MKKKIIQERLFKKVCDKKLKKTKGDKNSFKPRIYKQQTINKKIKNKQL